MRRAAREGLGWEERPPERLPDRPSTVDLNCNQCHVGHGTAKSYCLECHQNFNQTMPEAK